MSSVASHGWRSSRGSWIPVAAAVACVVFFSLELLTDDRLTCCGAAIDEPAPPAKPFVPPPSPVRHDDGPFVLVPPPISAIRPMRQAPLLTPALPPPPPADLWAIRANSVQRSSDLGRTWRVEPIDDRMVFECVVMLGPEVWAGGSDGTLYHSGDTGSHWTRIPVADGSVALHATITVIDALSAVELRIGTATGEHWSTGDGGLHWRRN